MAKLNNDSFKFYKGQEVEVTSTFTEGNTEYPQGQILTIEKIVRDCFVAGDGHKVSKIWLTNGSYFTSDFLMEHTKPRMLSVFRHSITGLKKSRNIEEHNLEQITKETDALSAFFGKISHDLDNLRAEKRAEIEAAIANINMGIAYYGAFDLAVQRFLIHCEETGVSYKINSYNDRLHIDLGFSGFKTILINESGIFYGGYGVWADLFTTDVSGAFESQAICEYYPADDLMACAIQKLLRQFLTESDFCLVKDENDDWI